MKNDSTEPRFVRRLTRNTLALVLAGGRGSRLYELTQWRAKPAVPFGGKFRIIDFPLSNCVNSGIRRIGVLTQYKAHSLVRHLVRGWSNFRSELGEFIEILPASQRTGDDWYSGTADAVKKAGRKNETGYQISKKAKELKRDMEEAKNWDRN